MNSGKLIAVVEDEAAIRDNYTAALQRSGYRVQGYSNRQDALSSFDSRLPDLVIIDINLGDEISAPLPNVGLFGGWAFTNRLALQTRFQYFYIDIDDVTGQLFQGDLGLQFHLFKYFDLGLDFRIFGVYGSGKNGADKVELDQINWGPLLSGTLRF